jgi:hypothetical protein
MLVNDFINLNITNTYNNLFKLNNDINVELTLLLWILKLYFYFQNITHINFKSATYIIFYVFFLELNLCHSVEGYYYLC